MYIMEGQNEGRMEGARVVDERHYNWVSATNEKRAARGGEREREREREGGDKRSERGCDI
jgi:hypothetical protein